MLTLHSGAPCVTRNAWPTARSTCRAVEATALGNVLVQARALGAVSGGLDALRALLRGTERPRRYEPSGGAGAWDAADNRLG
jgi:hypothetical protein